MKSKRDQRRDDAANDGLRAEAVRAASGEALTPKALIESTDSQVLRILRRGSDEERLGLIRLLASVGARGRKVAEQALTSSGLTDQVALGLLDLLESRKPDHPLVSTYRGIRRAIDENDPQRAAGLLKELPTPLAELWTRQVGRELLTSASPPLTGLLGVSEHATTLLFAMLDRSTGQGTVDYLAKLMPDATRSLRRAVRAAFFRLQQLGVATPDLDANEPHSEAESSATVAWVSAVDFNGDQAFWIMEDLAEGGTATLQAVIDEDRSIRSAITMMVGRRDRQQIEDEIRRPDSLPTTAIPVEEAIGLLEAAFAQNPTSVPKDYLLWRRLVRAERRGHRSDGNVVSPAERVGGAGRSRELLETDGCASWLLDFSAAELAARRSAESQSPIVLLAGAAVARQDETSRALVAEIWTPLLRRRWARRFAGTAVFMKARGERELATIANATGEAILGPDWQEVPVLSVLIERSVAALQAAKEREAATDKVGGTRGDQGTLEHP